MHNRIASTTWRLVLALAFATASCSGHAASAVRYQANVTTYAQMRVALTADARRCPLITVCVLGKSASGAREVLLVRYGQPSSARTLRLLVMCRQHGDEPAPTQAMLDLLSRLADGDAALRHTLAGVTLYIAPMVNPDGADADTRVNAVHADLNRDWGVFSQPETRAMARAVRAIKPQIIVDMHNWDGGDHYNANCIEASLPWTNTLTGGDAHPSSGFASWPNGLVDAQRALQSQAVQDLAGDGFVVHATGYSPESDPSLAHRYWMSRGIVAVLVETHAGTSADTADFDRRQALYTSLVGVIARMVGPGRTLTVADLDRSERYPTTPLRSAEDALFAPKATTVQTAIPRAAIPEKVVVPPPTAPPWLWPVCAILLLMIVGRCVTHRHETAESATAGVPFRCVSAHAAAYASIDPRCSLKARRLSHAPATGGQLSSRRDKLPCRYSPY
jgi:hypothetical protein